MKQLELETHLSTLEASHSFDRTIIENKIRDRRIEILNYQRDNDERVGMLKKEILMLEKELSVAKDKYIQRKNELLIKFGEEYISTDK